MIGCIQSTQIRDGSQSLSVVISALNELPASESRVSKIDLDLVGLD
jgi:hypothetical protein